MITTRDNILAAARVLQEGRPTHSLYAVEDAKALLKPIARFYWRQVAIWTACFLWSAMMAPRLLPNWPWIAAYFTGAVVGSLLSAVLINSAILRPLLAPPGLRAGDVAQAARHVLT